MIRIGFKTNLGICPDPVSVSDRGYMEVITINLNESLNIISDDSGFESIHLCIIFEYVGEESDVLEAGVSHRKSNIRQNYIHHQ